MTITMNRKLGCQLYKFYNSNDCGFHRTYTMLNNYFFNKPYQCDSHK